MLAYQSTLLLVLLLQNARKLHDLPWGGVAQVASVDRQLGLVVLEASASAEAWDLKPLQQAVISVCNNL